MQFIQITYWKFDFDRVYINWDEDLKPVLLIVASHTLKKMCVTLTSALDTTSERTLTSESKGDTMSGGLVLP